MERDPRIGCAGPALYQEDGSFDHAARRGFPTPLSSLAHFTGIGRRVESGPLAAYRAPEVESGPVDAVNGAFMLLRREALDEIGLFDEEYWMYMEDLDLNYRLARAGWITWYEPSVRAIHTKGGTSKEEGRRSAKLEIAFHRGMGRFYRKHYAADHAEPFNWLIYLGIGLKLLLDARPERVGSRLRVARSGKDHARPGGSCRGVSRAHPNPLGSLGSGGPGIPSPRHPPEEEVAADGAAVRRPLCSGGWRAVGLPWPPNQVNERIWGAWDDRPTGPARKAADPWSVN